MKAYNRLGDALEDVAQRSFYEPCRVYKQGNLWIVEDWHTGVEEAQEWSYDNGLHDRLQWLDHSRAMEPCEFFDHSTHIGHKLPVAVETLLDPDNEGAVGFTYVEVTAYCETGEGYGIDEHGEGAHDRGRCPDCDGYGAMTIGWALVATEEGEVA